MLKFWQRLKSLFRTTRWISEEEDLAFHIERLDREQPGWDNSSRIATVRYLLLKGVDRDLLLACYGEQIFNAATRDSSSTEQH